MCIFKNISYGKMWLTNNPTVYELFDKKIIYDHSIKQMFYKGLEYYDKCSLNDIYDIMNFNQFKSNWRITILTNINI